MVIMSFQSKPNIITKGNSLLLIHEEKLLQENYDFLETNIKDGVLFVYGTYNQTGIEYRYRVRYDGGIPKVVIRSPKLEYHIHMYKDNTLCLYYPKERKWDSIKDHLYNTIIPWTHEWILYYEIYRQTGIWEHPQVVYQDGEEKIIE